MSDINHNRMIPLHIANQAVAACDKEIATLKAEVERLRASSFVTAVPVEEYEKLKAEVERLKQEKNELAMMIHPVTLKAWMNLNAAKEGKQP